MGHSLGAHVSAFAAKNLQQSAGYGNISLLIGADPASPGYIFKDCKDRFCNTDAKRVVALHTSMIGLQKSLGHLDLWFNNGLGQPACGVSIINDLNFFCSHIILLKYMANMLKDDCVFIGNPVPRRTNLLASIQPGCSSSRTDCIVVDNRIFDPNYSVKGDYCVSVSPKVPYCYTKNKINCQK
ncbi:PREDICTED: phospholipase A1-like [Wasmannia auropunctata]|uniref:phospholipase A1-like n=1 Tax=Wasmannia auropunctata TaxID=64793 RepID=UPI0005EE499D|nr:PREDICTED: phospholipase A1-like [Wasmannia auropunctata]